MVYLIYDVIGNGKYEIENILIWRKKYVIELNDTKFDVKWGVYTSYVV